MEGGPGIEVASNAAAAVELALVEAQRERLMPAQLSSLALAVAGEVAQLVEHTTENRGVGSSILPLAIP